jgi:hypothetical protein
MDPARFFRTKIAAAQNVTPLEMTDFLFRFAFFGGGDIFYRRSGSS